MGRDGLLFTYGAGIYAANARVAYLSKRPEERNANVMNVLRALSS